MIYNGMEWKLGEFILQVLIERGPMAAQQISNTFNISIKSVSALLSGLKSDGYVFNDNGKWFVIYE